jgi:hypothetical protein
MKKHLMNKLIPFSAVCCLWLISCEGLPKRIELIKEPAFSEIDTFVTSTGNVNLNKTDYFLVRGNTGDRKLLKDILTRFVESDTSSNCKRYTNYMMFFYRESKVVNRKEIENTEREYRFKIFNYTKDEDYIASYSCWSGFSSGSIHFQPKYR